MTVMLYSYKCDTEFCRNSDDQDDFGLDTRFLFTVYSVDKSLSGKWIRSISPIVVTAKELRIINEKMGMLNYGTESFGYV